MCKNQVNPGLVILAILLEIFYESIMEVGDCFDLPAKPAEPQVSH
jgi:hypothetical protein